MLVKKGILAMVVTACLLVSGCSNTQVETSSMGVLDQNIQTLESQISALEAENASLEEKLVTAYKDQKDAEEYVYNLKEALKEQGEIVHRDALYFMDEGYGDNLSQITEVLMNKPEVIATPAVLGGTMFFTNAYLLTDRLILASFEDGHMAGTGIYEYWVNEDTLMFQSVAEYLDGEE